MTRRVFHSFVGPALACLPMTATAQDAGPVQLYAPPELVDSGLIKHILPRFTLKTRVRVRLAESAEGADIALGAEGRPLFSGLDAVWHLRMGRTEHVGAARFADWLTSEIGSNTIASFAPDGAALFGPPPDTQDIKVSVTYEGDAKLGHEVSRAKCIRCHVVDDESRGVGIGSTPSFAVLRSLGDWEERFYSFYALNPHPSFTIVADVTPPFPENRPPAIIPVELTLDEVEAVVAYVAAMQAADLGAPLQHQ
ncbi:c-type cytochrome [Antarctobacter jejuensis]|uniref:c-type cytochrome n=1 Tax=Antarctobacter jejuensis TaxID=1439938 RepID=UPI003FD269E1